MAISHPGRGKSYLGRMRNAIRWEVGNGRLETAVAISHPGRE